MVAAPVARPEIDLNENIVSGLGWFPQFANLLSVGDLDDEVALDTTLRDQAYPDGMQSSPVRNRESRSDFRHG
jgi:hypothetical protein